MKLRPREMKLHACIHLVINAARVPTQMFWSKTPALNHWCKRVFSCFCFLWGMWTVMGKERALACFSCCMSVSWAHVLASLSAQHWGWKWKDGCCPWRPHGGGKEPGVWIFCLLYWRIIAFQNLLFFVKPLHESAISIHISPPVWNLLPSLSPPHPSRLIQSPCLSFLSHTANSHWLSILHMVM